MRLTRKLWGRRLSRQPRKPARIELRYEPPSADGITVGYLEFDGATWLFRYDDAYTRRHDLRPIEGFGDPQRVYRSAILFPFFAVRVPDVDRPDIRRRLERAHLKDPETVDLLKMFGRRVVSSPAFELVPA